jgi:hypothetical protein
LTPARDSPINAANLAAQSGVAPPSRHRTASAAAIPPLRAPAPRARVEPAAARGRVEARDALRL